MERIGTLRNFTQTVSDFQKTQVELGRLQRQISSGINSETFDELGTNITRYLTTSAVSEQTDSFIRQNDIINSRLSAFDLSLKQMQDIATELRNSITQERSNSSAAVPLADIAKKLLGQVQDRLNVQVEGRYIFAGSKTSTRPVDGIENLSNIINLTATDNYYKGDNVRFSNKISEDFDLTYGLRANEQAFKDLIAGLHKAIEGDGGNDQSLVEALNFTNTAIDGLATLRNTVGNNQRAVENVTAQHRLGKTYLQEVLGNIINTDIPEATIQVSLNQTILQASFQVFSRIGNLKLVDFLR